MKEVVFNIIGPNSNLKTKTAFDVVEKLDNAEVLSIGSLFRTCAERCEKDSIFPESLTDKVVQKILDDLFVVKKGKVIKFRNNDEPEIKHTDRNGQLATFYAENPVFYGVLIDFLKEKVEFLKKGCDYLGLEGREHIGDVFFWMTTDIQTRIKIKRMECPVETESLLDSQIAEIITRRDLIDFKRKAGALKIPPDRTYIVRRKSLNIQEQEQIVEFMVNTVKNLDGNSFVSLPRREIISF